MLGQKGFDPGSAVIDWKDAQGFTVADAQAGVAVFGANGHSILGGPAQTARSSC